jgi:uncharacterized membrane protein
MSMKNNFYPLIIIFIILLTTASLYSFHLGFGFILSSLILGLLFYYNIKLGIIVFLIILFLLLYVKNFPKERENKEVDKKSQHYKIIKEPDNIEHEYDYKGASRNNNTYTNTDSYYDYDNTLSNVDIENTVEGMSNKKKNSGVDRISMETTLRGKDSKSLPISSAFGRPYKEPVSVGSDGTLSGYELIQQSLLE